MSRAITVLIGIALASAIGCADIAGVGDFKKEGEGGAASGGSCDEVTTCGAGLTCALGTCLRSCSNLAHPQNDCAAGEGCYPVPAAVDPTTTPETQAVCFPAGGTTGAGVPQSPDCAPGLQCVQFEGGAAFCSPFCLAAGTECSGANPTCHEVSPIITIDGIEWGACGP